MNDWKTWVIGVETTIIGFFIWAYFNEWLQLKKDVKELMSDKAQRTNPP